MEQLAKLKNQLDNPDVNDEILNFYLDIAEDVICDIRNSDRVEDKYLNVQIGIAVEMYNKRGAEGQTSHAENGIDRTYESSSISPSILNKITPVAKTPFSEIRVIE